MGARVLLPALGLALLAGLGVWWVSAAATERNAETNGAKHEAPSREREPAALVAPAATAAAQDESAARTQVVAEGHAAASAQAAPIDPRIEVRLYSTNGGAFFEDPDAAPLPADLGLEVVATFQSPGARVSDDLWRRDLGQWTPTERAAAGPLIGVLVIGAEPPVSASLCLGTIVLATQSLAAGEDRLTFTLDPRAVGERLATLRLRVLDAAGEPASGAAVTLSFYPASDERIEIPELTPTAVVERTGLRPGTCRIWARVDGAEVAHTVNLAPGLNDLGDLRLERTFTLRGLVVDALGNPLRSEEGTSRRDVVVECAWLDPETGEFTFRFGALSNVAADGEFLGHLEAGEYVLRARGLWMSRNTVVVVPGEPIELMVFPPTRLSVHLARGNWDGWRYAVVDPGNRPLNEGYLRGAAPLVIDLAPGPYRLRLFDTSGVLRQETPFDLGDEERVFDLKL